MDIDLGTAVSFDEKTAIAARSRKHPGYPAGPGRPARQEFEYVRHGTVSIVAAFDIETGQTLTQVIARNDSATFVAFLTMLDQMIDPAPGTGWPRTPAGTFTGPRSTPHG